MERSAYLLFSLQLPQVAIIATVCLVPVAVLPVAALKLDAVIRPALYRNHALLLDCPLVAFSRFWTCSDLTYIINL